MYISWGGDTENPARCQEEVPIIFFPRNKVAGCWRGCGDRWTGSFQVLISHRFDSSGWGGRLNCVGGGADIDHRGLP